MERDIGVRNAVVLVAFLLFSASGRVQEDVANESRAKYLFVQRDKPLPGSPKKLFKLEHQAPSRSSYGHNVYKLFRRVRRSLKPDMKPETTVLQAVNVDGGGKFSPTQNLQIPKTLQKPTDADNEPVHRLKAVVVNSSSIVLTWEKPEGVSLSTIQNYQVKQSFKTSSGGITTVNKTTKGKATTYTFKYLQFNTSYTFEVRTKLTNGDLGKDVTIIKTTGPFSASVGPLRKNIHDNSVILSWSAPWTIDLTKDLKAYNISWTCRQCYYPRSGSHLILKATTYKVASLQRDQTYHFYVYALTSYGPGEESNTTATISRYFGQVRNLRQGIDNNYTLTLQWQKPIDVKDKDIQRYLVSWCDTTTYRHCYTLNSTNVTGTETQFKKKLFAGDTYKFYVQAITAYGGGKESSIQVSVPALNLKVSYVSGYTTGRYGLQIYLYWRRWSIPYGQVVQYEVRWHCIRGRSYCYWSGYYGWQMQAVNTTHVTLNMTRYNTAYLFEVRVKTPQGRGQPVRYYMSTDALQGIPTNFTCKVTSSNTRLVCHWLPPTDVNPVGFYHYDMQYRCDDCLYHYFRYKTIYGFNQTSVNLTVNSGARYTVKIRSHTRYGYGTYAQTTAATKSSLGPVTDLKVKLDNKTRNLVELSWNPPSISSSPILYYVVVIECPRCGGSERITKKVIHQTIYSQRLSCGQTYICSVTAATQQKTSNDSHVTITMKRAEEAVANLTVKYIPGRHNGSDVSPTNTTQIEDKFLLTWDPPEKSSPARIEFYEITVMTINKQQSVSVSRTKATHLLIKCANLIPGKYYIFQSRCKALCGFGPNMYAVGYYPALIEPSPTMPSPAKPSPTMPSPAKPSPAMPSPAKPSPTMPSPAKSSPTMPPPTKPSPTMPPPTKPSPTKSSPTRPSPTRPSPTKHLSPLPQINNIRHYNFPYWSIPTAILGVILGIMVVLFVCKNYRRCKLRRSVENYLQDSAKDTPEEEEMPLLLESLTDDEMLITA